MDKERNEIANKIKTDDECPTYIKVEMCYKEEYTFSAQEKILILIFSVSSLLWLISVHGTTGCN